MKNPTCGNCTRGLLCRRCNSALGQLADDPQRLERALQYLLDTRARTSVPLLSACSQGQPESRRSSFARASGSCAVVAPFWP
uniref:endonuclease domain-containing protein n=1 Tax=Paractinoplanes polyasparticus TaxID=2856853 RepID=UPI001C85C09F